MTREEKQKAIDALKISAPVIAVTQEEFNDYIQILNKIMDWLEQEPCEELDFVQPHKKCPVNLEVCKMREATQKEREGIEQYIDSISIAEPCDDAINREDALMCLTGEIKETDTIQTIIARSGRRIRKLPSVTPQPKTGHWIEHPEIETSTPEYLMFYECSECGDKQCFCKSDIHKKRFCGNCGCRMVKPQKRSGEE